MKNRTYWPALLTMAAIGILTGCTHSTQSADVAANIRKSLDEAGLKQVSITQDRDRGIVTLGGQVGTDNNKAQAEYIARSIATGQVVADQIAVVPLGAESDSKTVNSDLDKGIEHNLDAALIQGKLHDSVKYAVKNHVVTLTGEVDSQAKRQDAERIAAAVVNVQQVVNDVQVTRQKATSSE